MRRSLPDEAKIFNGAEEKGKFRRFISFSFFLSLFATACFYTLRPFFLASPESNITHLLQVLTFISLGLLVPLTGVIAVFILGVGLHALLCFAFTLIGFVVSLGVGLCEEMIKHFTKEDKKQSSQESEEAVKRS